MPKAAKFTVFAILSGLCLVSSLLLAQHQTPTPNGQTAVDPAKPQTGTASLRVLVDPRIELMSIIFRLAGNQEYNQGRIPSYNKDVDAYFAAFKSHAAVVRASALRESHGVSFNAPMSLAIYLTAPPALAERVPLDPLPSGVDERWTAADARAFLADLRSFARDTKFDAFLAAHQTLYHTSVDGLQQVIREARVIEWFDGFFGRRAAADFIIPLGMLNGGGSYRASAHLAGGAEEIYSVLGVWAMDDKGLPKFDKGVAGTIVHEFCHSYSNPIVDAHLEALKAAGEKIFPVVESELRQQAYSTWQTMMYESVVRACSVRYALATSGLGAAASEIGYNRERLFLWTGGLSELLGEYEKNRAAYPTLDAFFPRVITFFDDYARTGRAAADLAALRKEKSARMEALAAKAPKVVSISPDNGAKDVDPALVNEIRITFDRPLKADRMALITVPGAEFPGSQVNTPRYDASRTTLTIPCDLKPDTAYGFSMNSAELLVMADDQGNPLVPLVYRFRTKK
ncbi:MAG: DUF4932 domain-containing protein [Candidatus Aminicenantales bacterium]